MMSFNMDGTQLSKLKFTMSSQRNNSVFVRAFTTVTPPPSPLDGDHYPHDGDVDRRPPHSYVRLVILALLDCEGMEGTIRDIYDQITKRFPYYKENRMHWKNSVRHNLTVFRCFERVARSEGETTRGSYRWKLIGDWQTILEKAEALQARKDQPFGAKILEERNKAKSKKHDKTKHASKEKENAKRRKRERSKKLKLKSSVERIYRSPLLDFNLQEGVAPAKTVETLPSRMPTPPPRLPGIDNVFLPSPAPSISPPKNTCDIWVGSPDFDIHSISSLLLEKESLNDYYALTSDFEPLSKFETEIELPKQRADWCQYTPEPSPAKSLSESKKSSVSGVMSSSTASLWEFVEPEVDGLMGLITMDPEWMSLTEEDFIIGL